MQFYKQLFRSLLTEPAEGVVREMFARLSPLPHLRKLQDSLLLFLTHYVVVAVEVPSATATVVESKGGGGSLLRERAGMVEQILRA